jgi:hypothetical protein
VSARTATLLGAGNAIVCAALVALDVAFTVLTPNGPPEMGAERTWVFWVSVLCFAILGALIVSRHPTNVIGWLFCAIALIHGVDAAAAGYAAYALYGAGLPGGAVAAWLFYVLGGLHYGLSGTFLLLLFPDGRLPSARWRPVAWASALATVGISLGTALRPGPFPILTRAENPFGGPESLGASLTVASTALGVVCILASAASLGWRMLHAPPEQRQQIKWVAYGGAIVALVSVVGLVAGLPIAGATAFLSFGLTVFGLTAAIAILRYRLYDIDLLINRTLVYGALTALLGAAFFGSIVLLQTLLKPFTQESDLAVAGSTLAVAAAPQPLRRRLQRFIDRRFYRRKYDAQQTVARYAAYLRQEVDLDAVSGELLTVVRETMQPRSATLWLRQEAQHSGFARSAP